MTTLNITLQKIIPPSGFDSDKVTKSLKYLSWYTGDTLDKISDIEENFNAELRLPIQAVHKFDERRIIASRIKLSAENFLSAIFYLS